MNRRALLASFAALPFAPKALAASRTTDIEDARSGNIGSYTASHGRYTVVSDDRRDAQRIYNYWTCGTAEGLALAPLKP